MTDDTLLDRWKKKAKDNPVVAGLILVVAVLGGVSALLVNIYDVRTIVRGEEVRVVLEHSVGQAGRIERFMMTGAVVSRWDAVISNTGNSPVSILSVEVIAERSGKALEYTGLYRNMIGRVFDQRGQEIGFPVDIAAGRSTRLGLELKVVVDSTAFAFLNGTFPQGDLGSLQDANKLLASALGIDFFGQKAEAMDTNGDTWGVAVFSDERQPRITVTFQTARGGSVSAASHWYSGGESLDRGEDPFRMDAVRPEER